MPLASPNPDQGDKRFVVTLTGMPCSFSRIYAPELPPYEEMNPVQQAYYALEKLSEELRGKVAFTLGNVNSDFAFRSHIWGDISGESVEEDGSGKLDVNTILRALSEVSSDLVDSIKKIEIMRFIPGRGVNTETLDQITQEELLAA
mgnify:CR=1 FL=1